MDKEHDQSDGNVETRDHQSQGDMGVNDSLNELEHSDPEKNTIAAEVVGQCEKFVLFSIF